MWNRICHRQILKAETGGMLSVPAWDAGIGRRGGISDENSENSDEIWRLTLKNANGRFFCDFFTFQIP